MSQYYRDFKSESIGSFPSGFSRFGSSGGTYTVQNSEFGYGYPVLRYKNLSSTTSDAWLQWDGVDSPGQFLDGEVLVKILAADDIDINLVAAALRFAMSGNQTIATTINNKDSARLVRHNGYSVLSSFAFSPSITLGDWYYVRLRVNGNDLKTRIWKDGSPEPSLWDVEINTTGITVASGYPAIGIYKQIAGVEMEFISVGTNGDPAPTGPVSSVATPVNLGVTNLQATSVRLTWEQG